MLIKHLMAKGRKRQPTEEELAPFNGSIEAWKVEDDKKKRKESPSVSAFLPLRDKTVAMIFSKPSLRTRVSFELGIHELGGYAICLDGQSIGLGSRESVEDVARLLSRYNDAIVARLHEHTVIEGIAKHATIPVINALTEETMMGAVCGEAAPGLWYVDSRVSTVMRSRRVLSPQAAFS